MAAAFPHLAGRRAGPRARRNCRSAASPARGRLAQGRPDRRVWFACSPENLRLGKAIEVFTHPDRVVVGVRDGRARSRRSGRRCWRRSRDRIEWMSVESAEMTKHALNAFLATSVTFINEIAALCEQVGADAQRSRARPEVGAAHRAAARTSRPAPRSPAARWRATSCSSTRWRRRPARVDPADRGVGQEQRRAHRAGRVAALTVALGGRWPGKRIGVWGLTYKPGTDTLRRSLGRRAVPTGCSSEGATCTAHRSGGRGPARRPGGIADARAEPARAAARAPTRSSVDDRGPTYREVGGRRAGSRDAGVARARREPFLGRDARRRSTGDRTSPSGQRRHEPHRSTAEPRSSPAPARGWAWRSPAPTSRPAPACCLCARDAERLEEARAQLAGLARRPGSSVRAIAPTSPTRRTSTPGSRRGPSTLFPQVHILVNNAGVYGPLGPIEDVDWDAWVRAIEINLFGSVLMCRALLPHFKPQRYGKIIQLSGGGATNPLPRISAYAASKAAIVRFAETLALEVAAVRHRRQRHRAGRAEHAAARRGARRRPGAVGAGVLRADEDERGRGRHAARARRGAGGVPRLGGERRHHRPAAQRGLGSVGRTCRPSRRSQAAPTSTRCGASCPAIAVLTWGER